jgi:GNAT superfamily N-acetyltransferase
MAKLSVHLVRHNQHRELEDYLRLYRLSFNADERVSTRVLRRVIAPAPGRVNPVHLFAAYRDDRLVGGACMLGLPAFQVVIGSYIFVDPALRGRGLGARILRQVLRHERRGPHGWNWRVYAEVTASSGKRWHALLAKVGFRFFLPLWPIISYQNPRKVVAGQLCYFPYRKNPPPRFSQPAMLMYIHALFYGPDATHRHLLPRLKNFVRLEAQRIHTDAC